MEVFLKVFDIKLDRNSRGMFENNCKEIDKDKLKEADLVFFVTGSTGNISHVGIYLKDNKFIHASSSKGVTVNDLDQKYYIDHYKTSGRVKH
jgi:Cell wall-associated hydrolases (invasion-associated proteins)